MKMNNHFNIFLSFNKLLLLALIITGTSAVSCKGRRKAKETEKPLTGCKIDYRLPRVLIHDMRKNELKFEWLSAKMACEAKADSQNINFDVTLRMRRDSIIWMNVMEPTLGIKVARILINKDSVQFVNYLNNSCFHGEFNYLSQMLQIDVDFDMMQSLLIGNSVSFYEEDEKLRSAVNSNECVYTLSTVRKRKLKKVLEGQKQPAEPIQTISLDPLSMKILHILFIDENARSFSATYSEFAAVDSMMFPYKAEFYGRGAQKSARLTVSYKKVQINQSLEFPFRFPDDCTPIVIPENGKKNEDK
ncbi:MAG: hypothetical protein Fur0041_12380 [Bacteroidia bacterium]